jgi:hypothetical protein
MRFSSIFQLVRLPAVQADDAGRVEATPPEPVATAAAATAPPPRELPDDLDARVRLLGEWQVSEL